MTERAAACGQLKKEVDELESSELTVYDKESHSQLSTLNRTTVSKQKAMTDDFFDFPGKQQ